MFFAGSPVIITRVFPAKNDFDVFKACIISVALIAVMSAVIYVTAGMMRGVEPTIVQTEKVMLQAYMNHAPTVLGLIGIAGVLTAAISTAPALL
jgi:sodium/pantothenate symporter